MSISNRIKGLACALLPVLLLLLARPALGIEELTIQPENAFVPYGERAGAEGNDPPIDVTQIVYENVIIPSPTQSEIRGSGVNDLMFSNSRNNVFFGGSGSNVFYCRNSGGKDLIINYNEPGEKSALRFHYDVSPSHVLVKRRGKDMVFLTERGSVTVRDWYARDDAKLTRVEFYGDVFWDALDVERLAAGKHLKAREYILAKDISPDPNGLKYILIQEGMILTIRENSHFQVSVVGFFEADEAEALSRADQGTTYLSTNVGVAEVDEDGTVFSRHRGAAQIIATNGTKTAMLDVMVVPE